MMASAFKKVEGQIPGAVRGNTPNRVLAFERHERQSTNLTGYPGPVLGFAANADRRLCASEESGLDYFIGVSL